MKEDISKIFKISENDLDTAVSEQPSLYYFYASKAVSLSTKERLAKINIDVVYAQREKYWREKLNIEHDKVTDSQIKAAIARDKKYIEAQEEHVYAKEQSEKYQSIVTSLEQRKKSLELIVQLKLREFHSKVNGTQFNGDAKEFIAESNRNKIRKKIADKRR